MMKRRKTIYAVLCLLVGVCMLSGCIEEYEADISTDDTGLLVVEGSICANQRNVFILSRTQGINDFYTPPMVRGAKVSVRGSNGSIFMTEETDGIYSCQIGALSADVEYYLHIEMDGDVYESEPQKPLPTEPIADVRGVQNTPLSDIDVLVTPAAPFEAGRENYYSWTYDETWEVHSDYTTFLFFDVEKMEPVGVDELFPSRGWKDATGPAIMVGASSNYEGQHIRQIKMYDIGNASERMYYKYSGLVHQRAISKAEYEYELARRQAGSEMGGLFTPQPSALPTNIRCLTSGKRVIGFVGCSLNTSDYRFFLHAADFSIYRPQRKDARRWFDDTSMADCLQLVNEGLFLCEWNDDRMMPGGKLQTAWAYQYQLDVRYKGAYIEEPDFWSLDGK